MENKLELVDVNVSVNNKEILKNISFNVNSSEVVIIVGPNGAGKSTISNVLMGNPKYELVSGRIILNGNEISNEDVSTRAKKGIFLSHQSPIEIEGITYANFLRTSYNLVKNDSLNPAKFKKLLEEKMNFLGIDSKFRSRFVNKGFSGGEKKKSEILQMLLLEPKFAILDEIDSGLDVDAIKVVAKGINECIEKGTGVILITHNRKLLDYIKADKVILIKSGKISQVGGIELIDKIDKDGFR